MELSGAEIEVRADPPAVAAALAERIVHAAAAALAARRRFRLVLAGGSTPVLAYQCLARRGGGWRGWEFYFGDERCLPAADPERNSAIARAAWFEPADIASRQVFAIPAELGAAPAAAAYAELIAPRLPFDLVLLGVGEDGHTASLFPGQAVSGDALVVAVADAPKPPARRVSLTPAALARTRELLIVATGAGKRAALAAWSAGADLPIARLAARARPVRVLLDAAAAGALGNDIVN